MSTFDHLRKYSIFANLSETELVNITPCLNRRSFAKGAYLFYPGSPVQNVYLLESGLLRIFLSDDNGEEFFLELLTPSTLVGMPLLYEDQVRLAGASALCPSVVISIAREDLLYFAERWPSLMRSVYLEMDGSARKLVQCVRGLSTLSIASRLAIRILYLSGLEKCKQDLSEIELPLSQTEMACWLGASRGHLNRTLSQFQKLGLIRVEGQKWIILDRPGLQRIAEEQPLL